MSVILPNRLVLSGRTTVKELAFPIPVSDFELIQTGSMNPSAGQTYFVTWSSDGLTLLHGSDSNNTLYARSHTVPYDISSGVGTAASGNITGNWSGGIFSPDGNKLFTANTGDVFTEYALSSPFDITTMAVTTNAFRGGVFHSQLFFSSDGFTMWNLASSTLKEWTLGTAFTLSTLGAAPSATLDLAPFGPAFTGWAFSLDGTLIYTVGNANPRNLASITLSTPFDITSVAGSPVTNQYDDSGPSLQSFAVPRGFAINPNNGNLVGVMDQGSRSLFELGRT